jgi:hypothetical protein
MEAFEGQGFEFVLYLLVGADQPLQIGFHRKALGLGSGAELRFEFRMDSDRHGSYVRDDKS